MSSWWRLTRLASRQRVPGIALRGGRRMSKRVSTGHRTSWARMLRQTCLVAGLCGCVAVPALQAQPARDNPAGATATSRKPPEKNTAPKDPTATQIRAAVTKAVPPLEKTLVVYAEKRDCYSCHNQGVPIVALKIARSRGFTIDEDAFEGAVALTLADLESARDDYRQGRGQPGWATRAGYAALDAGGRRSTRR